MSARHGCALASTGRAEPLHATASHVHRWLMVEQPGPWGKDAVLESRLPELAARELRARARRLRARLLLIRRHGRRDDGPVTAFTATTRPRHSRVESFTVDRVTDLLDLDLSGLGRDQPVGGTLRREPLFLVCTNGSHDPCCAEYGRPLAAAMDHALGDAVWECSHVGGDRFAGNLVCFPHGVYYGRVSPDDGVALAALHGEGLLDLERYRGRSAFPFVAQAADFFLRRQRRLDRLDDLLLAGVDDRGGGLTEVSLDAAGTRHTATIRTVPDAAGELLTCKATSALRVPRYELVSVTTRAA